MLRRFKLILVLGVLLTLVLAACGTTAAEPEVAAEVAEEAPAEAAPAEAGAAALSITGSVAAAQAWTEEEVKAMNTLEVESTNSKGETDTYTGVLLTELLGLAQPNADATTVVFVADDGYTAEVTLEELNACTNCIVSFRNNGGFTTILPGFAGSLQVKGVVEIQVK